MIKNDRAPYCNGVGVFYQYWIVGGFTYLLERVAREMRGRHKTYVSKVIQHPSNVCEIQIKKEKTLTRAGQYIFLCCPEISLWQYHPFTLTSAPEEDYISVHVRCQGDFTVALARSLGCDFGKKGDRDGAVVKSIDEEGVDPSLRRVLPRVYIDGPFGSASEDVFKFEVAVLVGAGIGVTPFASILKSIWYRMNYPQGRSRLRKVYFFWVIRDFGSLEWFRSLLMAIEAQDSEHAIEIHTVSSFRGVMRPKLTEEVPHGQDPPRGRNQHHDQRRQRRAGRHHGAAVADQLWAAQLGPHLQGHP
jgi:NADPH oxidase